MGRSQLRELILLPVAFFPLSSSRVVARTWCMSLNPLPYERGEPAEEAGVRQHTRLLRAAGLLGGPFSGFLAAASFVDV